MKIEIVEGYLEFKGASIRYYDMGEGEVLVFLHGYLLSAEVWLDFVKTFVPEYRVICIDLPGHGKSGLPESVSSMEVMAETVVAVLDQEKIEKATIFGHSMGGYTALALLEMKPELFSALALFHSHTLADSEEVRNKRDREVNFIKKGHRALLFSQSIPNMFATDSLEENATHVEFCKDLSHQLNDEEVIAAILGLRDRKDRSDVLENTKIPMLSIIGKKDNFIAFEEVAMKTKLPKQSFRLISETAGHMGFFEDREFIQKGIAQFLKSKR